MSTNQDIYLSGIGMFNAKGNIEAQFKILKNNQTVAESPKKTFECKEKTDKPMELHLLEPWHLLIKDVKYTIQLKQNNLGHWKFISYQKW